MRGAFLGLAMNHTPAHVARAVLEGCAYALRDIVERLDALGLGRGEIRIVGGGARDDLWATIKADVLGRPVRRVLTEEATAVGAAMVAGVGSGLFADFTAALVAVHLELRRPSTPTLRRIIVTPKRIAAISPLSTPSIGGQRSADDHRARTAAILAALRARGQRDLPDVDIRIGASVWTARSPILRNARGGRAGDPQRRRPVPYVGRAGRGSARRAARRLPGGPTRTGTVRADEETVERAVAEVGAAPAAHLGGIGHAH